MIAVTGNTYPVKDQIKALGGRWNADAKAWMVPEAKATAAQALIAGAPIQPRDAASGSYHPTKCVSCGVSQGKRNLRGYIDGPRILRSGECSDCYEERKMGY